MTEQDIKNRLTAVANEIREWLVGPCNPQIDNHRIAVERMMVALWSRQTAEEQESKTTRVLNGRGFNGHDADFAGRFIAGFHQYGRTTEKMAYVARRMLVKYSRQLAEIRVAREMDNAKNPTQTGTST